MKLLALGLVLAGMLVAAPTAGAQAGDPAYDQAVSLGGQAYRYGFPLMEFLRVRSEETSVPTPDRKGNAPVNTFSNADRFARPSDRTVVAPNVDTLYSISHLDLGKGPIVIEHPDMGRRYFTFELVDPYTNVFGYVGARTTGSKAGKFAISWSKKPARRVPGVRTITSRYRRVWVIGRTLAQDEPCEVLRRAVAAGGWAPVPDNLGRYGIDYDTRANIAVVGLGANTIQEATYPTARTDSAGALLDGGKRYRIVFPPGQTPPNGAFWSLTMYTLDGFLVPNAAHRDAIGSTHPPLVKRGDGSVVVAVQHDKLAQKDVNWLPAPPAGFRMSLRIYRPTPAVLSGAWKPPPIEPVP